MKKVAEQEHFFYRMIVQLREHEEIVLYQYIPTCNPDEEHLTVDYLAGEYAREILNHPYTPPAFHPQAALWAATLVYRSAQLLLFREQAGKELENLIQPFPIQVDASAALSADLTLRFMPYIVKELDLIDPDDILLEILGEVLKSWPYSLADSELINDFDEPSGLFTDDTLRTLFATRVLKSKNKHWLKHPDIIGTIENQAGMYADSLTNIDIEKLKNGS